MKQLSFSDIKSVKLKREKVEVPEWGGFVFVQELTGSGRAKFVDKVEKVMKSKRLSEAAAMIDLLPDLLQLTLVDESGNEIVTAKDTKDLKSASSAVLDRLGAIAINISGLGHAEVVKEAKN